MGPTRLARIVISLILRFLAASEAGQSHRAAPGQEARRIRKGSWSAGDGPAAAMALARV